MTDPLETDRGRVAPSPNPVPNFPLSYSNYCDLHEQECDESGRDTRSGSSPLGRVSTVCNSDNPHSLSSTSAWACRRWQVVFFPVGCNLIYHGGPIYKKWSTNALAVLNLFLEKDGHRMEVGMQHTIHCSSAFPNLLLPSPLQIQKMLFRFSLFYLYCFH